MRKKLPVLIALMIFSTGVGLSYAWSSRKAIEDFVVETLSPDPQGDKFLVLSLACGPRFSSHQYVIRTTGQSLKRTGESFGSADAAHYAFERRLSQADRILQRTFVLDEEKRQVGERAVAVSPSGAASILSRYGAGLSTINAPTVELALEFEATMEKKALISSAGQQVLGGESP